MNFVRAFVYSTVVVTCLALVAAAVLFLAPMTYSSAIRHAINSASGLELEFSDLELEVSPLRLTAVKVLIFPGDLQDTESVEDEPPLLDLEQLVATIDLGSLLSGGNWWALEARRGVVRLVSDTDDAAMAKPGAASDSGQEPYAEASKDPGFLFQFSAITISDFSVTMISPGEQRQILLKQLTLSKDTDERLLVELDGSYQGQAIMASGSLALPSSERARNIDFSASGFGGEFSVSGTVGSDGVTPGKAVFALRLDDPGTLGNLLGREFTSLAPVDLKITLEVPEPGSLSLNGTGVVRNQELSLALVASQQEQRYTIETLELALGRSVLSGTGLLDMNEKEIVAKLESALIDIDSLLNWAPSQEGRQADSTAEVQPLDLAWLRQWNIDVDAAIAQMRYQKYTVTGAALSVANDGGDLIAEAGVQTIVASVENVEGTEEGVLQLLQPLSLQATVEMSAGKGSAWPLLLELETEGVNAAINTDSTALVLVSALPAVTGAKTIGQLTARIENLKAIDGIETDRWDNLLPAEINVDISARDHSLLFTPLELALADSEIGGKLVVDFATNPLTISGLISGPVLDLNKFSTTSAEVLEDSAAAIDEPQQDVIGTAPIDWSWMNAAQLDIEFGLGKLMLNKATFSNVKTSVTLNGDQFRLDPIQADLSAGGIRGYAHISLPPSQPAPSIEIRIIANAITPADLGQKDAGLIDGGETDLLIDVKTRGTNPQELASALNGELALEIQHATMRNDLFEIIGSDLLLETLSLINPFAKKDDSTELECAAVRFEAVDGILTSPDQIVLETSKMKIRAGGDINLREETLLIDFVPSARKGLGIGLGNLASVVRLGGTLGKPRPVADPGGILKSGATIGAAIATGGVSLIGQGLFDRARASGTACGKIFENNTEIPAAIQTKEDSQAAHYAR